MNDGFNLSVVTVLLQRQLHNVWHYRSMSSSLVVRNEASRAEHRALKRTHIYTESQNEAHCILALKLKVRGWEGDTAAQSTDCSCRAPRFRFQHPHAGSQLL